ESLGEETSGEEWGEHSRLRYCICLMQFISKWAAPDMFAYVLLYYLIRRLQNLPVSTLCMFDIGFTCYSVFSITCAISSLGVPLPKIESDEVVKEVKPPLVRRMIAGSFESPGAEKRRLLVLVGLLATVWACLFAYGLGVPCFALRLDADLLKDHVPDGMKQVLKMIKLNKIIFPQNVSLVQAMGSLMYWFATDHDLNILLGFVMLAVFAVTLTALNMVESSLCSAGVCAVSLMIYPTRLRCFVPLRLSGHCGLIFYSAASRCKTCQQTKCPSGS
ncbi:unnamed protein product, partial [Prorocentrum cordatum]